MTASSSAKAGKRCPTNVGPSGAELHGEWFGWMSGKRCPTNVGPSGAELHREWFGWMSGKRCPTNVGPSGAELHGEWFGQLDSVDGVGIRERLHCILVVGQ